MRITVRADDDRTQTVKVDRALWKELVAGDQLVKNADGDVRRS